MSAPETKEREMLERDANLARARLATTLDVLDQRAHEAIDVKLQVHRHIRPIVITGVAVGAGVLSVVGWSVWALATRDRRRRRERVHALQRGWRHPDRVARYKEPPIVVEIGRKLIIGAVTMLAMNLLRRAFDGRA